MKLFMTHYKKIILYRLLIKKRKILKLIRSLASSMNLQARSPYINRYMCAYVCEYAFVCTINKYPFKKSM